MRERTTIWVDIAYMHGQLHCGGFFWIDEVADQPIDLLRLRGIHRHALLSALDHPSEDPVALVRPITRRGEDAGQIESAREAFSAREDRVIFDPTEQRRRRSRGSNS